MSITNEQKTKIEEKIIDTIRHKFKKYRPETQHKPFHYRLIGKDRMALFSFIQSLNTSFGTSIFEPVAEILATPNFHSVQKQYVVGNTISEQAQTEIENIINTISTGNANPNKEEEIERIREVCGQGEVHTTNVVRADLFVQEKCGLVHLFDFKTVKPNASDFKNFKRTLLRWVAIFLYENPEAEIASYIAIPYNPYEPRPYERWTMRGMLDVNHELQVAEELWNFLGGDNAYEEVLGCFERAGIELRAELDEYFKKFVTTST